ncbi:MAG: hypothetical protein IJI50_08485 [Ruminococcus sp.]|nr:hypothetical protein [Ruminococcus sp.]
MKQKLFFLFRILGIGLGIFLCLKYAEECSRGIRNGILFCIQVLVPSLFFMMVLSAYLIKSGTAERIARPLDGLSRRLFRLPYPSLAVIILAMIGGYPVGARCAEMLYEDGKLSAGNAERTAYIAVCAGPGFLMNFVGRALLGSPEAGLLLLTAQILSTLILALLIGRIIRRPQTETHPQNGIIRGKGTLIDAVADASRSTFHMCAMVVICTALIEVIATVSPIPTLTDISSAAIEITSGCAILCRRYPLALIAFFIGFGGISVHLQIFAACRKLPIRHGIFVLFRVLQGIITAGLTYILLMVFPIEVSVFNSTEAPLSAARSATLIGSAALVISALCFLGSVHKQRANMQKN